jgi:hypothetical protein
MTFPVAGIGHLSDPIGNSQICWTLPAAPLFRHATGVRFPGCERYLNSTPGKQLAPSKVDF